MAYTTLADLKTYLGISSSRDDDILTACLAAAIDKVDEQFTGKWESTADTRFFEIEDTRNDTLFVDHPLLSITTLTGADSTVIPSSGYWLLPRNNDGSKWPYNAIKLKSSYTWNWAQDSWIEIDGGWGFTVTPPDNLIQAVWRLAAFYYRIKDNQTFGTTGNQDLGIIETPAAIPKDVEELLSGLRHAYDLAGWGNS